MSRKSPVILAIVACTLLLADVACLMLRLPTQTLAVAAGPREVTDSGGRKVLLPARPARILSLCTSATDTLIALGAADRLAAIDEFGRIVPGAERAVVIGKGSVISREQVAALRIDLAFLWWYQDDAAGMLEELAVPVVRIRSGRVAEVPAVIHLVGDCVGQSEAAGRIADRIQTFVADASRPSAHDARRVFIELYGPYKTVGRDTYTNDLIELAGARSVATDAKGAVLFSAERLVQADPDVILGVGNAATVAALVARPGMRTLRAVRQGRVFALDRYWFVAGPNMPASVKKIRAALAAVPNSGER